MKNIPFLGLSTKTLVRAQIKILSLIALILMTGCKSLGPIDSSVERTFTYDYKVTNKSKTDLYTSAFNFIATSYGDSNSVLRVTDKEGGLIIGKGISKWHELGTDRITPHNFKFLAKDGRARLQMSIPGTAQAIAGALPLWPLPTPGGYRQIVKQFNAFSKALEAELKGESESADFSNF